MSEFQSLKQTRALGSLFTIVDGMHAWMVAWNWISLLVVVVAVNVQQLLLLGHLSFQKVVRW